MDAQPLIAQIGATPLLDWLALACSLLYVVLASRDRNACWIFAAVGSLLWAHQMLAVYNLVSDALLQLFYLVMAGVGLYRWRRSVRARPAAEALDSVVIVHEEGKPAILRMTLGEHLTVVSSSLLLGYALANFVLIYRVGAAMPVLDGITTAFSVVATFLLIARRLENWLYFVAIDAAYVFIYWRTGAYLYLLIMLMYIVVAVYGYRHWRGLMVDGSDQSAA
ncbi:nicotinamide riboside transporter PnuC [Neolewinella sp.]|uniref:nicotinamide riboside transporter PnuC n=1 Tax=Neolewinella sp. TaxID=2993543 RepID=UPI003B51F181